MITFKVDNVIKNKYTLNKSKTENNLRQLVGLDVEAFSDFDSQETGKSNNLLLALNTAYDKHIPVTLSPDMIWLTIAQGLSNHINNNAETLRHHFVNFKGKEKIIILEDFFIKGSPDNNWAGTFNKFSEKIGQYIGDKKDLIVGSFTTSTPITKAANEIVLMEAMQQYFSYECHTMCGIPEITLLGSVDDWKLIKSKVQAIAEFDLAWWTSKIESIIDECILAVSGSPNINFWKNIFKIDGGSGGPFISGWITHLFPYIKDYKNNNKYTLKNSFSYKMFGGLTTGSFPKGMAKVPFIWKYYGYEYNMELAAGFTGFKIENDTIVPNIGWAVRESDKSCFVTISAINKSLYSYDNKNDFSNQFRPELEKLGLKVNYTTIFSISGILPKDKLKIVKDMSDVEVKVDGE